MDVKEPPLVDNSLRKPMGFSTTMTSMLAYPKGIQPRLLLQCAQTLHALNVFSLCFMSGEHQTAM